MVIEKLTPRKVKCLSRLSKPGRYGDGGGLYLQITRQGRGTKSWVFRYEHLGSEHFIGLGALNKVSLAEAREAARDARSQLAQGGDPLQVQRERKRNAKAALKANTASRRTFDECVDSYIAKHRSAWRNAKHRQQWKNALHSHISPYIGEMSVCAIGTTHILQALTPLWATRTETASRLRGRIERVLAWATVMGYRQGDNPARWRGNLEELLPHRRRLKRVRHHSAMPYQEIGAFFGRLKARKERAALVLAFTILTACRSAEALLAQWAEIDLINAIWTIPAERTKNRRDHCVPLCEPALHILHQQQGRDPVWVFPGLKPDKPLSGMLSLLRRMNASATVHGFRSTFRVWAAEKTKIPREIAEMALAHNPGSKVETAYMRSDLFNRRRKLMHDWATWCTAFQAETPMS